VDSNAISNALDLVTFKGMALAKKMFSKVDASAVY
jgi:hypothetical protein